MKMKKVAFLSMDSLANFESYDHLLLDPLRDLGWEGCHVSWRSDSDWSDFDVVIVRSTWDYQDDVEQFIKKLEEINSQTRLENDLEIMKWNIDKSYLNDLEDQGIKIVPSVFSNSFDQEELLTFFEKFNSEEIIIKPTISANADNTFWLNKSNINSQLFILNSQFKNRSYVVQPFIKNIVTEGEYSLFYFGGNYSHAILKTPKENDFRVQEEHGGILSLVNPDKEMKRMAEDVLNKLENDLLYARIDFVRTKENDFAIMELELIEPSLYFNMDPQSAERFAKVFDQWMINKSYSQS